MLPETRSIIYQDNRNVYAPKILDNISDDFFILDREWCFLYVNQRSASNLGTKAEDLIGEKIWGKFPKLKGTCLESKCRQVMADRLPQEFERYSIITGKWYNIRVYSFEDGISVYWQDITHRKLIEKSLHETQQLAGIGSWRYDVKDKKVTWSDELCVLFERNPKLGPPSSEEEAAYYSPGQYKIMLDQISRALKTGKTISYDIKVKLPSRKRAVYHVIIHPIKNSQDRVIKAYGVVQDITKRKLVDEELTKAKDKLEIKVKERTTRLAESEEKYRKVVENASELIVVFQDGIKFVNERAMEITGYSREELLSRPFTYFVHPADRAMLTEYSQRRAKGERVSSSYEFRIIHKDGSTKWLVVNADLVQWQGKLATLGLMSDITERKLAEEALRQSEEQYRNLVDNANEGVSVIQDRVNKFINKKGLEITGYSMEELINEPFLELVFPDDRKSIMGNYQQFLKGEKVRLNHEFRIVRKDGSIRWLQINVANTTWEERPGILTIFTDITERKRTEEALKASEEKYRSVVENANEAIVITQDGKVKYFNPRLLKTTGYSANEVKSKPFLDFIYPEDRDLLAKIYQSRIKGEPAPTSYEYRVIQKDGSVRWMLMNAAMITWEGRLATLNIFTDITEEKSLRVQLTQYTHRLTQIQEEERKRIAYELHDDTAQYLAILKMQIGALANSEDVHSPKIKEKLFLLERDADRAFNDVRRYSHELRPVVLEHQGLLTALEQLADDYNKLQQIQVDVSVEGSEPELAEHVNLGFFRIAQEAVNNVRKHSKAAQAVIRLKFEDSRMEMAVSDQGIGFNIQEASLESNSRGSLGLMSMKERADLINADLKIESEPGEGTTVRVEKLL